MPKNKTEKKVTTKKTTTKVGEKPVGLSVPVFTLDGTKSGTLVLPEEVFGGKVNKPLLAQAIRVYFNNLSAHFGNTKTRAEVKGSTRKIRVQKGTGGARHGGVRAPIFVGGGIALGPKYRKVILDLPQKMKKAALKSALVDKMNEEEVLVITGLEKVTGKTKQMQALLKKIEKKDVLLVADEKNENLKRAVRNLKGFNALSVDQLNAYNIVAHKSLMLGKEAVGKLVERVQK